MIEVHKKEIVTFILATAASYLQRFIFTKSNNDTGRNIVVNIANLNNPTIVIADSSNQLEKCLDSQNNSVSFQKQIHNLVQHEVA